MTAPQSVIELIERFDRNRRAYKSEQYNEARLRIEFLNPFFEALGWDVSNRQGYAEAYKDVIYEDAIKIGGATKAPDYCFRIGGTRKFFVEAKKPAINLRQANEPAFQLRRYAWSAKLPLSILTDFEEFAIYDCRYKPEKDDAAGKARIEYIPYTDYPQQWDKIAGIFSREAILKGSFDTYAEDAKGKRGTAEVDTAFLQEIEYWREMLARHIAQRNKNLKQRELNYAVQMTIDRIIFLRICEDRGIEEYERLKALVKGANVYKRLCDLFLEADDRYNSGLFHFQKEKDVPEPPDTLTPHLLIDDKPLRDIITRLYYPDSPYEFSALPADVLGQVYEQFLGKVIRLMPAHQVTVEEKPEVRKAGGVYYTPTFIVDYIVKHTLSKLLEGKKPGPKGGASRIKIVDPACGSGSFLIGAYQYLLDWHRDRYVEDGPQKHSKELYQGLGGQWLLTTQEKKRILLNNIYGVDIDPQAVEVTKLSLLLKVLEGESSQSLNLQLRLFHERALPDLDSNIKCGNSLIGPDFYETIQMSFLDEEEQYRINVFDWTSAFPEVFSGDAPGFDTVIGNPPYGAYLDNNGKAYLRQKFKLQNYQLDSYLLFLEQSLRVLVKEKGYYGMIIPNPWLTNVLQKSVRQFVANNTHMVEIVHFRFPVFPKVTVDTEIVILQMCSPKDWQALVTIVNSREAFLTPDSATAVTKTLHEQSRWQKHADDGINIFLSPSADDLANKCSQCGIPLSSLCDINVGIKPYQVGKGKPPQTKETVEKRIYDSRTPLDSSYRRYLRGSDIGRYKIAPLEERYLKYGPWLAEPRPAANFNAAIKIVMRQTGDSIVAAIDSEQYLCLNNMHVLVPKGQNPDTFYIIGIVNSRLLNWYYHTLNPEEGEALAEVKRTNVAKLPIRMATLAVPADKILHDRMVGLVEQMLSLQKRLAQARMPQDKTMLQQQIDRTDRQIDKLVYELYGLTEEEIKTVEGKSQGEQ